MPLLDDTRRGTRPQVQEAIAHAVILALLLNLMYGCGAPAVGGVQVLPGCYFRGVRTLITDLALCLEGVFPRAKIASEHSHGVTMIDRHPPPK